MVITDGERVFLYRITPERVLEPEWTYRTDSRARVFAVQLAELAGDGAVHSWSTATARFGDPDQFTDPHDQGPKGGRGRRGSDGHPPGGRRERRWREEDAVGQGFAQTGFFKQGDATRVSLRNGKLVSEDGAGAEQLPGDRRGLQQHCGKGVRALAFIDEFNRLRIAIDTEDAFRSASPVGTGMTKLGVESQIERGAGPTSTTRAERCRSTGRRRVEEIIVPQNQIPGRLAVVYKGPAGYRFQTVNSRLRGYRDGARRRSWRRDAGARGRGGRFTKLRNTEGETQIIIRPE